MRQGSGKSRRVDLSNASSTNPETLNHIRTNAHNSTTGKIPAQSLLMQRAFKNAEKHEDEYAQHGTVRVLWRNGKPIGMQSL